MTPLGALFWKESREQAWKVPLCILCLPVFYLRFVMGSVDELPIDAVLFTALVAALFGFDTLAGDRKDGALEQLMMLPVREGRIIAVKSAVGLVAYMISATGGLASLSLLAFTFEDGAIRRLQELYGAESPATDLAGMLGSLVSLICYAGSSAYFLSILTVWRTRKPWTGLLAGLLFGLGVAMPEYGVESLCTIALVILVPFRRLEEVTAGIVRGWYGRIRRPLLADGLFGKELAELLPGALVGMASIVAAFLIVGRFAWSYGDLAGGFVAVVGSTLMGINRIAKERADGTLAGLHALPVTSGSIMKTKFEMGGGVAAILAVTWAMIMFFSEAPAPGLTWLVIPAGILIAYFVAAIVSSFAPSPARALLALVCLAAIYAGLMYASPIFAVAGALASPVLMMPDRLWNTRLIWWQNFDAPGFATSGWRGKLPPIALGLILPTAIVGWQWWGMLDYGVIPIVEEIPLAIGGSDIAVQDEELHILRDDGMLERRNKRNPSEILGMSPISRDEWKRNYRPDPEDNSLTKQSVTAALEGEFGVVKTSEHRYRLNLSSEYPLRPDLDLHIEAAGSRRGAIGPPAPFVRANLFAKDGTLLAEAIAPWPRLAGEWRAVVFDPQRPLAYVVGESGLAVVNIAPMKSMADWYPLPPMKTVYSPRTSPTDTRARELKTWMWRLEMDSGVRTSSRVRSIKADPWAHGEPRRVRVDTASTQKGETPIYLIFEPGPVVYSNSFVTIRRGYRGDSFLWQATPKKSWERSRRRIW